MRWMALARKSRRIGIGLMSGTSCDGVDAAVVSLSGAGEGLRARLSAFRSFPYDTAFRSRLLAPSFSLHETLALHALVAERLADAARAMLGEAGPADFIASHGHTLAHVPPPGEDGVAATVQVGDPRHIAAATGLPVVADFRPRDIAAGGQGAPLVPYADWVLFRRPHETVAALNIGGIANFTVVTPRIDSVYAFDTGPGNMIVDGVVRALSGGKQMMDVDGNAAARGAVVPELYERLMAHPYFALAPPKSTGRELFGVDVCIPDLLALAQGHGHDNLVATVTAVVADSIADAFQRYVASVQPVREIVAAGGGASNPALMNRLAERVAPVRLVEASGYGVPADAREAVAFAILGNETLCARPSNVPRATGARQGAILGSVWDSWPA